MTNTNRPTKVIKTATGDHTVELYTYLTAREKASIDKVIAKEARLSQDAEANANQAISAVTMMEFADEILRTIVKSIDGKSPAFEIIMDMESGVADEIRPEAQKVYDEAVAFQTRSSKK